MSIVYRKKGLDEQADLSHSTVITADISSRPYFFRRKTTDVQALASSSNRSTQSKHKSAYDSVFSSIYESAKYWFSWAEPANKAGVSESQEHAGARTSKHSRAENDHTKRSTDEQPVSRKKFHLDTDMLEKERLREQLEHSITPKKKALQLHKDPFNWDTATGNNSIDGSGIDFSQNDMLDISPSKFQYGTRLYKKRKFTNARNHSTALVIKPSEEVSYLQTVFNGGINISSDLQVERQHQLQLLSNDRRQQHNASKLSIINLTERIKNLLLENRARIGPYNEQSDRGDDLIFLQERKVDPVEEKRKQIRYQTLKFDRSLLTFEQEFSSYKQLIEERRKIVEQVRKTKDTETKIVLTLSDDQLSKFEATLNRSDNAVLSDKYMLQVTVRDFKTLAPRRWLNDTIIEFFMKYVEASSPNTVAFNSFFYSTLSERGYQGVRRWMKRKKASILDLDKVFTPINLNDSHWALGIIDLTQKKILYVDSLSSGPNSMSFAIMKDLQAYVLQESNGSLGKDFELCHVDCPQQPNGYDCGIYVCLNTLYFNKNLRLNFDHNDAANMRAYIGNLILSK